MVKHAIIVTSIIVLSFQELVIVCLEMCNSWSQCRRIKKIVVLLQNACIVVKHNCVQWLLPLPAASDIIGPASGERAI